MCVGYMLFEWAQIQMPYPIAWIMLSAGSLVTLSSCSLLCTEGSDSTLERLAGLSKALASMKDPRTQSSDPDKLVSSVFLERVSGDGSELLDCLHRLRALLQRLSGTSSPVRLLVLDSIAAPTREAPGNDYAARAAQLLTIACLLRRYADEFEIAVLVSNQVLDIVANDAPSSQPSPLQRAATGGRPLVTGGREVTPALGLAWASAINTRLFLSKDVDGAGRVSRTMHIVWAPDLPPRECEFQVTRHGTFGLLPKQKCEQTQGLIRACNDRSLELSI